MADIMKEHVSDLGGMSMGVAPPVYPPDQTPLENGPHGYFPGIEIGDPVSGARLFSANCATCHGVGGAGGYGPRLVGLAARFGPSFFAWRVKDPVPPMPKLVLTNKQIADLAAYLETLGTTRAKVGAPLKYP
jgi:cytochrome c